MKHLLEVKGRDGELLLSLHWQDGVCIPLYVHQGLKLTVDRWTKYGISECVVIGADAELRETKPNNPEFLSRLEQYIKNQTGFSTSLKVLE